MCQEGNRPEQRTGGGTVRGGTCSTQDQSPQSLVENWEKQESIMDSYYLSHTYYMFFMR